jgi:hypothetical protein
MIEPDWVRLALVLPIGSIRAMVAATHVAIFLISELGRTEIDVPNRPRTPPLTQQSAPHATSLFVATSVRVSREDVDMKFRLAAAVRTRIERAYARQGISPVWYDLQVL